MADANSLSDTQVLLQSMLQKLKLQPKPESTHMQDEVQFGGTLIKQNGRASESPPQTPPMYDLDFSMDSKSVVTNRAGSLSPGSTGVATSLSQEFAKGIDVHNSRLPSRPKQRAPCWDYKSYRPVSGENHDVSTHANDGVMPNQTRQQKFSLKNKGNSSVSSLQSIERLFPSTSGQEESNIQNQEVGQKKWTQKVKEKWKERHKISIKKDDRERLGQTVSNSIISPIPVQNLTHGNNITTTFDEDVKFQHQPINNGSVEDIPSLLGHMSETLFSPGSFNLMEEIFTGQEWARFLPSITDSQSASRSITHGQEIGLRSSISQLHQNDQNMLSQWNYREKTATNLGILRSQINSEGFHNMGTSENMFNQRNAQSFSQVSHNSQYRLSDSGSNHLENVDLSSNPLGNNHLFKEQTHIYPYNQSNNTEPNVRSTLSSEQNQSHMMEINHNQHGSVHEVLPVLDLSYLQPKDCSSLKMQVLLGRKRGHATERSDSNAQWRWRNSSSSSTTDPAPSLSPASSTSSLQYSVSRESESSVATETVIKKRRVENTRNVRFADEVTIIPPLFLSDEEGDSEHDEDYSQNSNMIHEDNDDGGEESPSRPSVPRWIEALRSKTKKQKFKLPRMRTKKYHFM